MQVREMLRLVREARGRVEEVDRSFWPDFTQRTDAHSNVDEDVSEALKILRAIEYNLTKILTAASVPVGEIKRRFEYKDVYNNSFKFWESWRHGSEVWTRYGRLYTDGTTIKKDFRTDAEASAYLHKKIHEKLHEGYREV